jgi:competence protein ComEC
MMPMGNDLRNQLRKQEQHVRLRFQIVGDPRIVEFRDGRTQRRIPVKVLSRWVQGTWEEAQGRVQLRVEGEGNEDWIFGSNLDSPGIIQPAAQTHAGLRRADWILEVDPEQVRVEAASFVHPLFHVRSALARRLREVVGDEAVESGVLQALLLGRRTELDDRAMQKFAETGLVHIFALSGLHFGILWGILTVLCKQIRVPYRWHGVVIIPLLSLFAYTTGMRASAIRALIMIAVVLFGRWVYRKPRPLYALSFALLIILLIAPEQIGDVGFQFSFLLVGGLMVLGPEVDAWLQARFARDPWAPVSPLQQWTDRKLKLPLIRSLGVSFLCVVLSAPLTAYTFHLFSPIGLVGNLVAVPLVFLLLLCGFPALLFLGVPQVWSGWALLPAQGIVRLLLAWVDLLEKVPRGTQWVRSPALWVLLAGYGLLFVWMWIPKFRKLSVALGLVLSGYLTTEAWLHYRMPELVVLDADRGQAAWIRNGKGEVLLIDTGSEWTGWQVAESLRSNGIDKIAGIFLTHPDRYHVGGLPEVLDTYTPKHIWVAGVDHSAALFQETGIPTESLKQGDELRAAGWTIDVLWPPADLKERSSDDRSLVLRMTDRSSALLFMGGASERVEIEILKTEKPVGSRMLISGHHRTRPGSRADFLHRVSPQVVVFSGLGFDGVTPARLETESRVENAGIPLFRTKTGGYLRFRTDKVTWIP